MKIAQAEFIEFCKIFSHFDQTQKLFSFHTENGDFWSSNTFRAREPRRRKIFSFRFCGIRNLFTWTMDSVYWSGILRSEYLRWNYCHHRRWKDFREIVLKTARLKNSICRVYKRGFCEEKKRMLLDAFKLWISVTYRIHFFFCGAF